MAQSSITSADSDLRERLVLGSDINGRANNGHDAIEAYVFAFIDALDAWSTATGKDYSARIRDEEARLP